jgi:hypothetical protein
MVVSYVGVQKSTFPFVFFSLFYFRYPKHHTLVLYLGCPRPSFFVCRDPFFKRERDTRGATRLGVCSSSSVSKRRTVAAAVAATTVAFASHNTLFDDDDDGVVVERVVVVR